MQLLRRWWFHLIGGGVGFRRKAILGQEDALQAAGNVIGVEKGRAHGI